MRRQFIVLAIFILILFTLTGCTSTSGTRNSQDLSQSLQSTAEQGLNVQNTLEDDTQSNTNNNSHLLMIHFIDVGQGDAILVQMPGGENMLIDGGEREAAGKVLEYLQSQRAEKLDVLLATHPHSDHIGGLAEVIHNMEVKKVYMPEISHSSQAFLSLLSEIKARGLTINKARAGVSLDFREVQCSIIAPVGEEYDDINNYSAVVKLSYGDHTFIFTGDAEEQSEKEQIDSGAELRADVLKLGHHGSSSSSSKVYLDAVSPEFAVIMCGKDNSYGHPHKETLQKLEEAGVKVYRTDQMGNIIISSDGESLSIITEQSSQVKQNSSNNSSYIGNINTHKFHSPDCSGLPREDNRIYFSSREEAIEKGYSPCGRCRP